MTAPTESGRSVLDEDNPAEQLNEALRRLKSKEALFSLGSNSVITELQSAGDDFIDLCQQAIERGYALRFDDGPPVTAVLGKYNHSWLNAEKHHGQAYECDLTSKGEVTLILASEVPDLTFIE